MDLSLELKQGCSNLGQCFRNFTAAETLEGKNAYRCVLVGRVPAKGSAAAQHSIVQHSTAQHSTVEAAQCSIYAATASVVVADSQILWSAHVV